MIEELFEESMSEEDRAHVLHGLNELDAEEQRLQNIPSHGKGMGAVEFQGMRIHHPDLTDFFDEAAEILNLSSTEDAELIELMQEYLAGTITDARLDEMKRRFFVPYMKAVRKKTS